MDLRVFFLSFFDPFLDETGPSVHLRGLSQALAKLGCETHILVLKSGRSYRAANGVQLHYVDASLKPFLDHFLNIPMAISFIYPLKYFRVINRLCREYRADIVHAQSPSGWRYGLSCKGDIPYIVTSHSMSLCELESYFHMPFLFVNKDAVLGALSEIMSSLLTFVEYKYADKVIAVSKALAEDIIRFFRLPRDRVVTIYNGIDLQNFADLRAEYGNEEHMILSVGRLVWRKGYKYLIDAMPHVLSMYPDAKLVIVGHGGQKTPLRQYAKKLGIENYIFFLSGVSRERLYSLFYNAEVYVQPSLYEPFGITLLEAMSMRRPVVATSIGGIREIITNGVDGLLVEPRSSLQIANAIVRLLSDSSLRRKLGDNARTKVEKEFTWEIIAKKTLELYKSLLHDNCPFNS